METITSPSNDIQAGALLVLQEFSAALAGASDEQQVVEALATTTLTLFSTKLVAVFSVERVPSRPRLAAVRWDGDDLSEDLRKLLLTAAENELSSSGFKSTERITRASIGVTNNETMERLSAVGVHSLMMAPVTYLGTCTGVLVVAHSEAGEFSSAEGLLLLNLATQAGSAIGKTRAYKEACAQVVKLSFLNEITASLTSTTEPGKLFPRILSELDKLIHFSQAGLYVFDEKKQTCRLLASKGLTPEERLRSEATAMARHPGWVFRHRQPLLAGDAITDARVDHSYLGEKDRPRATLCVPILFENRCFGSIGLSSFIPNTFTEADLQVVIVFANHAAIAIENARLHERNQRSLARLNSMQNIIQQVSANLELSRLLPEIVKAAASTIGASLAWVGLVESNSNLLKPAATYHLEDGFVRRLAITIDDSPTSEGPTGLAIRTKCPQIIRDCQKELALEVWREETAKYGFRSELAVPLLYEDRVLGAITIYSEEVDAFDDDDLALLKAFANQAAIAIENARLFEQEKQTVVKLQELYELTAAQHAMLERAISSQLQLTKIVLEDQGIDTITETLARLVSNPVVVEDQFFKLISHSSMEVALDRHRQETITRLGTPEEVLRHPEIKSKLDAAAQELRPVLIPSIPECGMEKARLLAPIVAGKEILGYVSILESGRQLEELDHVIVDKAAVVLALEIMKQRTGFEVELRLKADFIKDLLSVTAEEDQGVLRRAAFLGYDLSKPSYLLIARLDDGDLRRGQDEMTEKRVFGVGRQMLEVVDKFVRKRLPQSLVASENEVMVILIPSGVPANGRDGTVDPFDFARALKAEIDYHFSSDVTVSIAVGSECLKVSDYRKSYDEAIDSLEIGKVLDKKDSVLSFQHLAAYHVLFQCRSKDTLAAFIDEVLGPLMQYEAKHRSGLLDTLEVYLQNNGNLQNTAKALFVHINTLNYRLRRIEEIGGLELQSAECRFNLQLALKIRQLIESGQSSVILGCKVPAKPLTHLRRALPTRTRETAS